MLFMVLAQIGGGSYGESAAQITEDSAVAAEAIAEAMNGLWEDVLGGGLYAAIARLGVLFAVGTLLLFMVQWTRQMIDGGNGNQAIAELIWPLIVIVFLANNATVLADFTRGMRAMINQTNQALLESTSASVRLQEAYQQVMAETGATDAIRGQLAQCAGIADPTQQSDCVQRVQQQAQQVAPQNQSEGFQQWVSNAFDGRFILSQINSAIQMAIRGWLISFSIAFQWVVEISWLLTALLGPLAVGGSLLPVGQKAIFAWITGFFSVAMVKICFNIIAGLAATLVLNAGQTGDMTFPFLVGILAPVLSLILASGGGMAVFNSLNSMFRMGITNILPIRTLR